MQARLGFWRGAARRGARWLWDAADHVGRVLTVVAVVGVPTGSVALLDVGWWAALVGLLALVFLILAEGAFAEWNAVAIELRDRDANAEFRHKAADLCFAWVKEVRLLLDARAANEPPQPVRGGLRAQVDYRRSGPPEPTEQREAREAHQRETVALYIERYRERGVQLLDLLVKFRVIVDKGRPTIHAPRTVFDVGDAADIIEAGAERL